MSGLVCDVVGMDGMHNQELHMLPVISLCVCARLCASHVYIRVATVHGDEIRYSALLPIVDAAFYV